MLRRVLAIIGSAAFLVLAPGFVAGVAPWWISHWRVQAPFLGISLFRLLGGFLLAAGRGGMGETYPRRRSVCMLAPLSLYLLG